MKRKIAALATIGVIAVGLFGAQGASAATEFGDSCLADDATNEDVTLFELSVAGNPLPTAAPSAGVITSWKVNLTPEVGPLVVPQTLSVLRLDTAAKTAQVIASANANIPGGASSFPARIPVQAGDRLALSGPKPVGTLLCEAPGTAAVIGGFLGTTPSGGTAAYVEVPAEARVPVSAVIEPDADNDGFGDETQDKCPQSAAVQVECPVAILDTFALPKKGAVVVLVDSSITTPVTVSGKGKLPKGKVQLRKVTKTVTPGKLGRFVLKLPASAKKGLAALPKGKSLKLKITASVTNVAGSVSKDSSKVKLKG